jgi:hypothetical protein
MFILVTALFLFITALALLLLRVMRPDFRFGWLAAASGAFLAWLSVVLWQLFMPITLSLPAWQPAYLFKDTPQFFADQLSWPYALSLASLSLALIVTAVAREDFPDQLGWASMSALAGLGILAALADNPLTLALVWGALDLAELVSQIRAVEGEQPNERAVAGFAARILGTGLLLWAGMTSLAQGVTLDFHAARPEAGTLLILAAGLRLGVIPLHLAYSAETALRRGNGTVLRLVAAASSLILLSRIPAESAQSQFAPFLLIAVAVGAVYGGFHWIRSSDELSGRPYWVIGLSSLALASTLRGNPTGSVAWGIALILSGGALFLSSLQNRILSRALVVLGVWGVSSLPFSPTATGWLGTEGAAWARGVTWPLLLTAQALLAAGYIRHALRPAAATPLESQPIWSRNVYPFGIGILLFTLAGLGLYGWDGARQLGSPLAGLIAAALTALAYWLTPRLPWLNPIGLRSTQPGAQASALDSAYGFAWNLYQQIGRVAAALLAALEGDGGILWALLFLVLFISLFAPSLP